MANPICEKHNEQKLLYRNGKAMAHRCKSCRKEQRQKYKSTTNAWKKEYRKNPEVREKESNYRRTYEFERLQKDIFFKMKKNLRSRLSKAIRKNWIKGSAIKNLGCSMRESKQYIESKFQPGMTWDNYGQWHFDHIIPLSSVLSEQQLKELCHYSNLQPLWAKDNILKSNKVEVSNS